MSHYINVTYNNNKGELIKYKTKSAALEFIRTASYNPNIRSAAASCPKGIYARYHIKDKKLTYRDLNYN